MKVSSVSQMRSLDKRAIEEVGILEKLPLKDAGHAAYYALRHEFGILRRRFLVFLRYWQQWRLYGFGTTAHFVLKIAQALGIKTYVSTRSATNIARAKKEGAAWVGDTAKEGFPCNFYAAVIFPPAGNLVEPALFRVEKGATVVMTPVSSSQIVIDNYSINFLGTLSVHPVARNKNGC